MPREDERPIPAAPERLIAAAVRHRRTLERLGGVLILTATSAAAALALSPGLLTQQLPFDDHDLGQVATATVKATRDYAVPDDETTSRMRDEAVDGVRAVYVYDAAAVEEALQRVHEGFAFARTELGKATDADVDASRRRGPRLLALRHEALDPVRGEIERRLESQLEDDEFQVLTDAGFSEDSEEAVSELVTRVMREPVVPDREELGQNRERGIVILRSVPGGKPMEEALSEVGGIHDLARVRSQLVADARTLERFPPPLREAVGNLARREVRSNLKYDPELTHRRRQDAFDAVKPVVIQIKKGEKIIGDGERIGPRHLLIFRGMRQQSQGPDLTETRLGGGLLAALLCIVLLGFARAGLRGFHPRLRDGLLMAGTLAGLLLAQNIWNAAADVLRDRTPEIPVEAWTFVLPFSVGAMLVRSVLGAEAALVFSVVLAGLAGVVAGNSLQVTFFVLVGSLVAAERMGKARDRGGLFRAGLWAGLMQSAAVLCFALFAGKLLNFEVLASAGAAFVGGGLLAPALAIGISPAVEWAFGYVTDLQLMELASLNHPALKELIVQAPGTYHHSIIVGTLVEGAAQAVSANPILAKVCAYYHDLGKGRDPLSFGENQKGGNRHDALPPEESARIIIRHVSEGLELARKYRLPEAVLAAIPEHHGTRLVGFFFHKAQLEKQARPELPEVDAAAFRYPGPKPQSRETALVMMADACEAASRAMAEPTSDKLRALVSKLLDGIAADGQLDECELTMRDLTAIGRSFCNTLESIYHARPDYPAGARGAQVPAPERRRFVN